MMVVLTWTTIPIRAPICNTWLVINWKFRSAKFPSICVQTRVQRKARNFQVQAEWIVLCHNFNDKGWIGYLLNPLSRNSQIIGPKYYWVRDLLVLITWSNRSSIWCGPLMDSADSNPGGLPRNHFNELWFSLLKAPKRFT